MIQIFKGQTPARLRVTGAARARAHCAAYDADRAAYANGSRTFSFSAGIFSHSTVKTALAKAQHGKCCYCEAAPTKPYAYLHVEHWRPKSYSQQARNGPEIRPGYYWLAYDWDNLLLSCAFCNSSTKRNIFPLFNPMKRARNHHDDIGLERPTLLKPDDNSDPRDHIGFHEEVPVGITSRGTKTIQVLGLDRTDHASRLTLLNQLKKSHAIVGRYRNDLSALAVEVVGEAREFIARAIRPDAPFSAMASAFVERNPTP
jgi:uncharacterized protein (TIGR02646 family)